MTLSQKIVVGLALFIPFTAPAAQARQSRLPIASVNATIRKHGAELACQDGTPMNGCVFATAGDCKAAFTAAIDSCLEQSSKVRENFMLTKDQQRTLFSATLTCSQTAVLKTHPLAENNKCLTTKPLASEKASFENRYVFARASETQTLALKTADLQSDRKNVCPNYKGSDATGCAKSLIKTYGIHSAASAETFMNLLAKAASIDRAAPGSGPRPSDLNMLQAQLWLLERIDPKKFTLAQMKAASMGDQMSRQMLILIENRSLARMTDQVVGSLELRIEAPVANLERAPASLATPALISTPTSKEERLRKRLAKIKTRVYQIKSA